MDLLEKLVKLFKRKKVNVIIPKVEESESSREYKIFKKEESSHENELTLYEKLCNLSERLVKIEPDEKTRRRIQKSIDITSLKITPVGSTSFAVLFSLLSIFFIFSLMILNFFGLKLLDPIFGLILIMIILSISYYLYKYPIIYEDWYKLKIKSEIVLAILYISIYLRNMPNLENAIKFSAENLDGPLGREFKKLIWDLELGKYDNIYDAINEFLERWKDERYFVESIEILLSSLNQDEKRRKEMIDMAINRVLEGSREKAKHYNQNMRVPVTAIHAFGILLPTMGMVLFPIIAIFLSDIFRPMFLFVSYDIILPITLYFFISSVLRKRPISFRNIDISESPEVAPKGKFYVYVKNEKVPVPAWTSLLIAIVLIPISVYVFLRYNNPNNLWSSIPLILSISITLYIYFYLLSFQKIKLKKTIENMESEFSGVLFEIGNQVAYGVPLENAIERAARKSKSLDIKKLLITVAENIKKFGMTLKRAFFDKEKGALKMYPSSMITSITKVILYASKKGNKVLSSTMINISRYLKYVHDTEEEIRDILSEVTSSVRFQAVALTPIVSAVITTLTTVIIKIINYLSELLSESEGFGGSMILGAWGKIPITPSEFQIIVGIYVIETSIILSWFINGIERGDDDINMYFTTAKTLLTSTIVYIIVLFVSWTIIGRISLSGLFQPW